LFLDTFEFDEQYEEKYEKIRQTISGETIKECEVVCSSQGTSEDNKELH
jgi:hypothetical protein